MGRQVIAVDIDDVLFDEHQSIRLFANDKYGLNHTAEDFDIESPYWGYWAAAWNITAEDGRARHREYILSDKKSEPLFIPHSLDTLKHLKKKYDLVIITSRDALLVALTRRWLDQHFPELFNRVEFVAEWFQDHKGSKAEIASTLGASYLIDDSADHCKDAADAGIHSLLFGDYGYSRWYKGDNERITRVADWKAVKGFFDAK